MNKVILVTGAAGNMGTAVVRKLLDNGSTVVGTILPGGRSANASHERYKEYTLDATDSEATQQFVANVMQNYNRIDFAALLIGGFALGTIADTSLEDIRKMLKLNFETAFITAQAVYQQMQNQTTGGHLMFVGAKPALETGAGSGAIAYAFSKSLIFKLADYINESGKKQNIKASVIVPSILDTPPNRKAMPKANFKDWVTPEEIAEIVSFLVSEKSSPLKDTIFKIYGNV